MKNHSPISTSDSSTLDLSFDASTKKKSMETINNYWSNKETNDENMCRLIKCG